MANAQALHDLENGATGLTLVFAGANGAYGFGLEPTAEAIGEGSRRRLHRCRDCDRTSGRSAIAHGGDPPSPNISSARASTRRPAISASASIRSAPARSGDPVPMPGPRSCPRSPARSRVLPRWGSKGPFAVADGRVIHDAGGSEVQELAFVLATGVAYLRALEGAGIALEEARRHGLCAAQRRCRSVPDDGEIPRAAPVVGAHRTGLRPCAEADRSSPPKPRGGC